MDFIIYITIHVFTKYCAFLILKHFISAQPCLVVFFGDMWIPFDMQGGTGSARLKQFKKK